MYGCALPPLQDGSENEVMVLCILVVIYWHNTELRVLSFHYFICKPRIPIRYSLGISQNGRKYQ